MNIEQKIQQAALAAVSALYGVAADEKMVQLQKTPQSPFSPNDSKMGGTM